ncbi:2-aminoethylphosphonate--pyruvate transaminase-like [Pocillopora verrucosa]|uniref:2-aminoethylphosphonate--pyruvate transaminase-like n=1 Tax=Pocillopora verrucosa TaxID=203993 RepID=UPI003341B24F
MAFRSVTARTLWHAARACKRSPQVLGGSWRLCSAKSSLDEPDFETHRDKKLFTPGPLGVSFETKRAMLRDLGSRDTEFIRVVKTIRSRLLEIAGVSPEVFTTVLLQGSGTYAVEAVLTTTTPREGGKVFIIECGSYGKRMMKICEVAGIETVVLHGAEDSKVDLKKVEEILKSDKSITNVAMVHCETSTGVIHPVAEVGKLVKAHAPDASFFVDAMSSFGAVPLNLDLANIDFMVSSANKCIEGVPGFSFVIGHIESLKKCKGWARSLSLDIVDQYEGLNQNGQFRFTPATHAMLAFRRALSEFKAEGGVDGRANRYMENCNLLQDGMRKMGFKKFLDDTHEGYIITSYYNPKHPNYNFEDFYNRLNSKDQVIYPGKVSTADCFRIGNIGKLYPADMQHLLKCIEEVLGEMGIPVPLEE